MNTTKPQEQVNEQAEKAAALKKEKTIKAVKFASIAVVAIVVIVLAYIYAVRNPAIESANEAIAQADIALLNAGEDTTKMVDVFKKYEEVSKNHGQDAGNHATLMTAIGYYQKGEYQKCIDFIDGYSKTSSTIDAGAYSLKGDCYVNLKKYDEALGCFSDALSAANENPYLAPFIMAKQARIYNEKKDYAKELEIYETIKKDYAQTAQFDVEKYINRAKTLMEKK